VSAPSASVVLLTRNAMPQLAELWQRLAAQEVDGGFEVVAVDSESDDGTAEFLAARADRLIRIPRERFNHGATRNLGIEAARAERVAFLVQDALPASPRWLAELAAPLADECVAGAFSRQIPAYGASALARHQLAGWVTTSERPRRVRLAPEVFASLPPLERLRACAFDNVSSCLRREVWRLHPFPDTPIAEDIAWGKRVLLAGYEIAYAPDSAVIHSHDRSLRYEFERTLLLHEQLQRLFGLETIGSLPALARAVAASLPVHVRCLVADAAAATPRPAEWLRVLGLAGVWPAGQYLGVLRGRRAARLAGGS
jgi:rhamnosyltransferase